jgi:eukaryotic-like serine/threonine-protein kinase
MSARMLQNMVGGRIPVAIGSIAEVELLELLGSGGFGWVWKAADVLTGNLYVLKIIQDIIPGSIAAERVRMEAEVVIPSEYVVRVVGLREWNSSTFLILFEYFSGRSLDLILEEGVLTSAQKKNIFKQMLTGVLDAHLSNVIHRDLKPANILVGDDGRVKVIDFGISKFKTRNITRSGQVIGTIPYMAPELLIEGAKVADSRSDIYSLGHILYELAMGQHFWTRRGWSELEDFAGYIAKKSPPPTEAIELDDFHCDFYPGATLVLPRMVKLDREERYTSVDEVLTDLGESPYLPAKPPADLHLHSPLLIVETGGNRGARIVLGIKDGERRELGRADIAGNDTSMSRSHAEFSRSGDHYFVRDLASKRGTLVRGIALDPQGSLTEIHHADRIKIGDVFLRFVFMRDL